MKKIVALGLVLIMVLALAACGSDEKKNELVGTWVLDGDWVIKQAAAEAGMTEEAIKGLLGDSLNEMLNAITFTFNSDGTGNMTMEGEKVSFKYTAKDGKLSLTSSEGETENSDYTVKNGKLTLSIGGEKVQLKKK